jgi:protein tyrosine/serine phosphatase
MGINIVVDLRQCSLESKHTSERTEVRKLGMQYIQFPWQISHPNDATLARFLALVRENQDKKIFVHCHLGTDRTGMMIAACRMAEQDWTAAEATREMEVYGFLFAHKTSSPGLAAYEQDFPNEFAESPAFQGPRTTEPASESQPKP